MQHARWTLIPALAVALTAAGWAALNRPREALAATQGTTPGQLTILDRSGKPAALCPLKHTDVTADVSGYVARVTVTQEFTNPSSTAVEAVYTFPLPGDAAVDDMMMTIGKRVIRGEIMKREEAREVYEAAKSRGQAAALLDQERPNIFTQSVANILPGDTIKITIRYVNLLKYEDGRYEFNFPMVVGPRFVPAGGYGAPGQRGAAAPQDTILGDPGTTSVVRDPEKITPPITPKGVRAGHDISVRVNLDAGLPLGKVDAVLHDVDIRRQGRTRALIRLRDHNSIPNRDFVLRYTAAGSEVQAGMLTHATLQGGVAGRLESAPVTNGYFTLILQPPAAPPQRDIAPKEMVFVIDQTGSQSGWPIAKAKETVRHCIKNLNPGDTFQLLAFNTEVYPCFDKPVPATPETVQKALAFLNPIEGNGGTDILKAVDRALSIPDDPTRLRIVCYMTDGYVGNDMQIIDYVGKHRGSARMFPFGVGNSVNRFLIDGMAREGRGTAEYVLLNEPGEAAAARFYKRIASPVLLDPQIDWGGLPVDDVYPRHIPDVFSAGPIIVKGRYTRPAEGDITIHGILRGQPWSRKIHVRLPAIAQEGEAIPTLWARERIEDLQNQDWIGAQTGSPKPGIMQQIVNTALEYRLMSQYTSFVAVEQRVINAGGRQRTVDVPVEMPQGVSYGGIFGEADKNVMLGRGVNGFRGGMSAGAGVQQLSAPFAAGTTVRHYYAPESMKSAVAEQVPALRPGAPAQRNLLAERQELSDEVRATGVLDGARIARGDAAALAVLAKLKPEERQAALKDAKLSAELRAMVDALKPAGRAKPIEVQVWLNELPKGAARDEAMKKLKAAGFHLTAPLLPDRLLLGEVAPDKLNALLELGFVRRVELPRTRR